MKELFIVVQYRHGSKKGHSYIYGVFNSLTLASLVGKWHGQVERGSYMPEIIKVKVPDNTNYIVSLTETISPENYQYNFFTSFPQAKTFDPKIKYPKLNKWSINDKNDFIKKPLIQKLHEHTNIYNNSELSLLRDLYEQLIRQESN